MDWGPLYLTFKLALITTLFLLVIGVFLANWLAHSRFRFKAVAEALITMPLVLPPSVLGFYLLVAFGPQYAFGQFLIDTLHINLVFTFSGLVVASILYSLPFMVQPIQSALQNLPDSLRESSYTLGKSKTVTFFRVLLPNIKPSILTGLVLSFTHTIGEFGVVLMIGGSIPDSTKVISIAIYEEVEALNYSTAHFYAFVLFAITFSILVLVYSFNKKPLSFFAATQGK